MDLLAVQQALKSLLQHHSSKASILQCSFFFIVQLSHPYMTTGKTITLTRQTFVSKVSSLIFNMLPRFVTEKEMETHSSILVWKLPQMGEPGVLQSTGSQESDMTERLHSVLSAQVCHSFSSKGQASFNFTAAVTICSDFGAQENKVSHCFHCFPIYLP